jgi:hypothetical protein
MKDDDSDNPEVLKPGQVIGQQQTAEPQEAEDQPPQPEDQTEQPGDQIEQSNDETTDDARTVEWTASEYLDHEKSVGWYFGLALLIIGLAAVVFLIVGSIFSSIMILLIGIALGIAAGRRPRTVSYGVNSQGIKVGEKYYTYDEFKSFSLTQDGAVKAIVLLPFKRFVPPMTIHYEPSQEDDILTILTTYLPNEEHTKDPVEQLMRRVRF